MIDFLHKIHWKNFVPLLVFSLLALPSFPQAKFIASANETEVGKNDLFQIEFKIENAHSVRNIEPPSFQNFSIVSGPNQERGSIISNGNRSFFAAISFVLRPQKTGSFSIPPATAIVDGKKMSSNAVIVKVVEGSNGSVAPRPVPAPPLPGWGGMPDPYYEKKVNEDYILRPGEDPAGKIKKNLHVRLVANKTHCYVGEPVVVSFKIYTRLLSKTSITEAPSFNGFSVTEMDVNDNAEEEVLNGKVFSTYTLRKVQLFPTRPGTFTISPLRSVNRVSFLRTDKREEFSNDPFLQLLQEIGAQSISAGGMVDEDIELKSNQLTIQVKPLPEKNKPANFKGAVGDFSIRCSLQHEEMSTDDAGDLALTIAGGGNMALVNAPDIRWPEGVDYYDAKITEQLNTQQVPVSGTKTFHIPFTVNKPGNYTIPPIHFSWFNPATGQYDSSKTEPIPFHVARGAHFMAADLKEDGAAQGLLSISGMEMAGGIVLVSGLAVLLLFVFFRKRNRESDLEAQIRLDDLRSRQEPDDFDIPGNPLESSHDKLTSGDGDAVGFYQELNAALKNYLSRKLRIPLAELTSERIVQQMDASNIGIGTTRLFESLIREIELGLYARSSHPGQMRDLYEKAAELIALLEKQIHKA